MRKSIVVIIIVFVVIIVLVRTCQYFALKNALEVNKEIALLDSSSYSTNIPEEYLNLFLNKKDITGDSSLVSIHRSPVSRFHNKSYYIQVYKIDSSRTLQLRNIICAERNTTQMSPNTYYVNSSTDRKLCVKYILGPIKAVSSVFFDLYGNKTQIIKRNDSLIYYYSDFKNFSLRFDKEGKIAIYGTSNSKTSRMPVEILFLKRHENVYFIILTNRALSPNLSSDALYNLIVK